MQFKQLCGGLLLLALIIGAFFLPTRSVQAAPATTYHHVLPSEAFNSGAEVIATLSFQVNRRGTVHITTSQEANLGTIGKNKSWYTLTITSTLDGSPIKRTFFSPSHRNLIQVGVAMAHNISPGKHFFTLMYDPELTGDTRGCFLAGGRPECARAIFSPGTLTLKTP